MKWFKIEIHTETEAVDALTYLLEENGIEGAVIEDPNDIMFTDAYQGDWDYAEETARQIDSDDVVVRVFVEDQIEANVEMIQELLKNIESNGLNIGKGSVEYEIVDDEAWKDKWKEFFKTFKIGTRLVIKPSWEEYVKENDEIVIEMDPGSAFGSGTHETTSMCVKLIEKVIGSDTVVYDIGCGTGILGIAAAKLGATKVIGVDIAEEAIVATNENAVNNGLESVVEARLGNLTDVLEDKADIVVANIMADIIIGMTETIQSFVKPGGYYITSGIIEGRQNDVLTVIEDKFTILEHINEGEWHAILAKYEG